MKSLAMVAVLLTALGSWMPGRPTAPPPEDGMLLGITHTQYSLDPWLPAAERTAGEQILDATPMLQNQHLMGFGALNPEPSPGVYDWSTLDQRMALISRTGGTPVLTLCCAPDWMKGGKAGDTDWTKLTDAPLPSHYADFAALAAEAASRYPQVHYFQVWNELKGFWDATGNTWDAAGFTAFYNEVYDAVKRVRPDASIGGPYAVFDTWASDAQSSTLAGPYGKVDQRVLELYRYWNEHKHGADFVSVDASTRTKDKGLITSPAAASAIYADVTRWVHALTGLPVWWAEFYPDAGADTDQARAAATLDAVAQAADAGAAAMLLWQPQETDDLPYGSLWTDPASGAVRPTYLAQAWTWLVPRLRDKAVHVERDVPGSLLRFTDAGQTLTVNLSGSAETLPQGDGTVNLGPFGIHLG